MHYSNYGYFVAKMVVERSAPALRELCAAASPPALGDQRNADRAACAGLRGPRGPSLRAGGRELPGGRQPIAAPAGNWLASVVDLARFLTAVSGAGGKPLLSAAARQQMLALPPPPLAPRRSGSHVGLGWDSVTEEAAGAHFQKLGSAAGGRAYIEHRPDGIDWVVLLNSDGQAPDRPPAAEEIIDKIRRAIDAMRDWPDRNLFEGPATPEAKGSVVM